MSDRAYFVHPAAAYVDEPCAIGAGHEDLALLPRDEGHAPSAATATIGQNVFVAAGVRIGDHCKIQNNVSLYTGVVLEDHVFCGPSMVFTNVVNPRSEVVRKDEYRQTLVKRGSLDRRQRHHRVRRDDRHRTPSWARARW